MAVDLDKQKYNELVAQWQAQGWRTTGLRENETDFADYGNALSDELQQELLDSFDCEQDYKLQELVASMYNSNRSVINSSSFISTLRSMGLTVSVTSVRTSYISDAKAHQGKGLYIENGGIAVYTISDGKGGEIKIADANGNGSLEIEEVFMNQILGDIDYEIEHVEGPSSLVGHSGQKASDEEASQVHVSQSDFNNAVEKYAERGLSLTQASMRASEELGEYMSYTGTYFEDQKAAEEEAAKEEELAAEKGEQLDTAEIEVKDAQIEYNIAEEAKDDASEEEADELELDFLDALDALNEAKAVLRALK